ncbi:3'-5' exonuclease [Hymenobacter sp. NST-14]|uniref:3'-5' exonuclease n=1 Tax=Hymenobacter piscis TaxID=2839984 RepID=UPI001C025B93|nr:3'-5' exonuclease [Hymenobacter piscis]MBT9394411.1 3'-5' exonuclease [Hymenobacter piscis]
MRLLFLDTETTGLLGQDPEVLSLALVDGRGRVLLDTLVRPERHTEWPEAEAIHGIPPAQVLHPDVPTLAELTPQLLHLLRGAHLVIYNAAFEGGVLGHVLTQARPRRVECAMLAFAEFYGEWHTYYQNYRWQSLSTAAAYVLHEWDGPAHTALADTHATRAVWRYLNRPSVRRRIDVERTRRRELATEQGIIYSFLWNQEEAERLRLQALNDTWTQQHFPDLQRVGLVHLHHAYEQRGERISAQASAEAFSVELTGFGLQMWHRYGERLLLPRYGKGHEPAPAHLVPYGNFAGGVYFLTGGWRRPAAAMLVVCQHQAQPGSLGSNLSLQELYDVAGLREGVDYVRYVPHTPAGHYTRTELKREFKLSAAQLEQLRPVLVKRTRYGVDCLLYAAADVLAAQAA